MYVILPETGCNILNNSTSFYNYSTDRRTRNVYYIYDGKAFLQSSQTSPGQYTYTGDCLSTGDLIYKPELQIYFPIVSFCLISFVIYVVYSIIIKRLLP